mmetsp:Transcript_15143/g.38206  ORF Transcript_15143/g.38206 Transcript_15143/m.38206 type:complete len:162 (-) Transcript_15143:470-955(-)
MTLPAPELEPKRLIESMKAVSERLALAMDKLDASLASLERRAAIAQGHLSAADAELGMLGNSRFREIRADDDGHETTALRASHPTAQRTSATGSSSAQAEEAALQLRSAYCKALDGMEDSPSSGGLARPLPHIIGSRGFFSDPAVGLGMDSADGPASHAAF